MKPLNCKEPKGVAQQGREEEGGCTLCEVKKPKMNELHDFLLPCMAASSSALVARRPFLRASPGEYSLSDARLHSILYTASREGMSCSLRIVFGLTAVSA